MPRVAFIGAGLRSYSPPRFGLDDVDLFVGHLRPAMALAWCDARRRQTLHQTLRTNSDFSFMAPNPSIRQSML